MNPQYTHTSVSLRPWQYHLALNHNAQFTAKSSYLSLLPPKISSSYKWIWKLHIPPKIIHFLWLCSHERLPTKQHLHKLTITPTNLCDTCQDIESISHIFVHCPNARHFGLNWTYYQLYNKSYNAPSTHFNGIFNLSISNITPFPIKYQL